MIDIKIPQGHLGQRTADGILAALAKFKDQPIRLWIDNAGGEVFHAIRMFEALQLHRPLTTIVHGQADSAASIVFLAGFPRVIEENSTITIHDPGVNPRYTVSEKDKKDGIRDAREWMIGCYVARTGAERATIEELMTNETRMNAEQAVALGFAHTIARAKPRTNNFQRLTVPGAA